MNELPKITFGMIVLNGEPFLKYNLRAIYPFAHQIIVVEGAAPHARNIASPSGHSTDETLQSLASFRKYEDPENKLVVITAEAEGYSNGFWPGEKDEQSRAYACRATGDYLWQVDVDEFYKPKDMHFIANMLAVKPEISAVSFNMITFWGGFQTLTDSWYLRRGAKQYHRLFRWQPGYQYITHRPPTVVNELGINLREIHWITGDEIERSGIQLYHYSLVFPKQVKEKCDYYCHAEWAKRVYAIRWAQESFLELKNPYRVHNVYEYPSWLEPFVGEHPPQIYNLQDDIATKSINVEIRNCRDVNQILSNPAYSTGRELLKLLDHLDRILDAWKMTVYLLLRNLITRFKGLCLHEK